MREVFLLLIRRKKKQDIVTKEDQCTVNRRTLSKSV
jgi:hypothetical protein